MAVPKPDNVATIHNATPIHQSGRHHSTIGLLWTPRHIKGASWTMIMWEKSQAIGFSLAINDEGWPPFSLEWLHVCKIESGLRVETLPLFIRDISVMDVIRAELDNQGLVQSWSYVEKSKRSVVWIMIYDDYFPESVLEELIKLGCNTEALESLKYYAIDVPAELPFEDVHSILGTLDKTLCAVAFPSFRHEETREI